MFHTEEPLDSRLFGLCEGALFHSAIGPHPERTLFFDIETTGLSADTAFVFLIGCICLQNGSWLLHQFLISRVQEEADLLSAFFKMSGEYDTLVHFNGTSFDLPFLQKRAEANRLCFPLASMASVDLYQRYRPLKKVLGLPRMNQRTLEEWLGWQREDCRSGREVVRLFRDFSSGKNSAARDEVLQHNRDDLCGLVQILQLEGYLALKGKAPADSVHAVTSADPERLCLKFSPALPLPRPFHLTRKLLPDGTISLDISQEEGVITVPIFSGTLLCFLDDYKNYYYLPMEGQAVHKSVAAYVAKEYREPATPRTCFLPKTGRFLPQPAPVFTPVLRESYDSDALFFEYRTELLSQEGFLSEYLSLLLTRFLFSETKIPQ